MLGFGFLEFCTAHIPSPYKCLPNATTSLLFPYPFYPCSCVSQSPRTTPMFLLGKSPWRHQCLRYPCRTWWWRQELTCYSSVSSPPTPHPKVSCRESWRLAGCGEENLIWGQDRFPGILLPHGGEEKNCQTMGLPQLWCLLEDCPPTSEFLGLGSLVSGVRTDSSKFPKGKKAEDVVCWQSACLSYTWF